MPSKKKSRKDERPRFETCMHMKSIGEYAVFVEPTCRQASMIKGILLTPKHLCASCPFWEPKEGIELDC